MTNASGSIPTKSLPLEQQLFTGIQLIHNYKPSNLLTEDGDPSLEKGLNHVFACFEVVSLEEATIHPLGHSSHILTAQEHEVRCTLRAVNPKKAAGTSNIPGSVLRKCTDL